MQSYQPVVATDNGTFQPTSSAGAANICKGGDVNFDGRGPDLTDLSYLIGYLVIGTPQPPYLPAANADGTGQVDISDLSRLIGYLLGTGVRLTCK